MRSPSRNGWCGTVTSLADSCAVNITMRSQSEYAIHRSAPDDGTQEVFVLCDAANLSLSIQLRRLVLRLE